MPLENTSAIRCSLFLQVNKTEGWDKQRFLFCQHHISALNAFFSLSQNLAQSCTWPLLAKSWATLAKPQVRYLGEINKASVYN